MNDSVNAVLAEVMATPPAGPLPVDAVVFHPPRSLDKAEQMVKEKETPTPAIDMVSMFSAALTEIINKAVDKRVNQIMENVAVAKLMDSKLEERITEIVQFRISEHVQDEPHQDVDDAIHDALSEMDIDDAVERSFRNNVNWEDMVDERVREQVEELVPSDDELHDKVRMVLNDVTFTVSVD